MSEADGIAPSREEVPHGSATGIATTRDDVADVGRDDSSRASERRFRAVQDASPIGFAIHRPMYGPDGAVVDFAVSYVNEAGARVLQQPRERLLAGTLHSNFPGPQVAGVFAEYVRVLRTGEPSHQELLYAHEELVVGLSLTVVRIGEGADAELGVSFADVTPRLRAEEERTRLLAALGAERERLRAVILHMPAAVALTEGPEHRFTLINDAYQWINGVERPITGRTPRTAFPELAGTGIHELFDRVYASGEPWVGSETWIPLEHEGARRDLWVNARIEPVRDADGRVWGLLNFNLDVSAQVRARRDVERLLAESERARERTGLLQRLTLALSTASTTEQIAAAVVAHASGIVGAAGSLLARLTADGAELEILHAGEIPTDVRDSWRRFPVDAPVPLAECARTGRPVFLESRADWTARFPGMEAALEATGHHANVVLPLVVDDRVLGVLGVAYDAPRTFDADDRALAETVARLCAQALERARLFEAEQAARAEADAANRAKGEFLAVMSHELRTPLNAIGGYSELMEMELHGPVTEQQREDLRRIQVSQRHLLGLINEVLNYARLETGSVRYDLDDVPMADALRDAVMLISPQAHMKGLTLDVPQGAPEVVAHADAEKLRQILVNLLSNAVKFTDRGGRIAMELAAEGHTVQVLVRDSGIGIPPDKIGVIFEPFVQVRSELTRPHEGAGLGLAISRDLARGMSGDLTVESTPGVGSTFTLTVPRARA